MPKVMIIAGEASGDLHGGKVVRAIRALRPDCAVFGIGGDAMREAGMEEMHHVRDMAFLGFAEVVKHLPFIRKVLRECEDALRTRKPDVLLLIDYPGFNLKLAGIAHRMGIRVVFYISPQVWAWKAGRVRRMRCVIDTMLVIFPFEVPIYEREQIPVRFVGHPLLEAVDATPDPDSEESRRDARRAFCIKNNLPPALPLIGMFPGSRTQELHRMLPTFVEVARLLKSKINVTCVIGAAPTVSTEMLEKLLEGTGIPVVRGQSDDLQRACDVALTKSGTSTLEMAIAGTPMVVLYKTSALSYRIGRSFALIEHIAMPNILAGKKIVPEFIQHEATPERLTNEMYGLLTDPIRRANMIRDLANVRATLGTPGASQRVAEEVVRRMEVRS